MPSTILGENAVTLPTGTTANRPTPEAGMVRYNTSNSSFEGYNNGSWVNVANNTNGGVPLTASIQRINEVTTVSATGATGTVNFDLLTQAVLYYTSNASDNWTLNIRGNSSTTLNNTLNIGESATMSFLVTNGSTAYRATALNIDGSAVTPKFQGGVAPSAGNINSVDIYNYTVFKTANATFTVFASLTKFA
jgi:hypothetical protein